MITCPDCGSPWPAAVYREPCPGCGMAVDDLEAADRYLRGARRVLRLDEAEWWTRRVGPYIALCFRAEGYILETAIGRVRTQ